MKKQLLSTWLMLAAPVMCPLASAQVTPWSQMEHLDRGIVALPSSTGMGNFVSWRFLGTDSEEVRFDLLRDGITVASDLTVTNYNDFDWNWDDTVEHTYQVITKLNGKAIETSSPVKPWTSLYKQIKLDRPANGKTKPYTTTIDKTTVSYPNGQDYSYSPNDMSVGDVDGDGEYELFVKWDPDNSKDNSQNGVTGNVIIDCYKLDGTKLWRIDLGRNIRAGAHYTQFQVYDYDGDGKAEMICKTAPGSLDGKGHYVSQAATESTITSVDDSKDWTDGNGRIPGGQEYLTVFSGTTGEAIHTIFYNPNRNQTYGGAANGSFNWGAPHNKSDAGSYGNRGERYLAATAYLDGPDHRPSGIFCRGYYGYAFVWAVDFDGQQLHQRWLSSHKSGTAYSVLRYDASGKVSTTNYNNLMPTSGSGSGTLFSNGNHNLSIGDVDGDGCDEIVWGSAALDHDGTLLYGTGFGHGDAIHLGALDPDRGGMQVFQIHEEKGTYAWDIHDAATGEIILKGGQSGYDNGRGVAADIVEEHRGYEFWSSYGGFDASSRNQNPFNVHSNEQAGKKSPSMNFRIYWDGDPLDELLDGVNITKYKANSSATTLGVHNNAISNLGNPSSCNSTKATPCLSADIFGDWREELILWSTKDHATINIYTTDIPSDYRVPTLMHDHTYRMGICWQNTAYNQPPHLGYYLPDYVAGKMPVTGITAPSAATQSLPEQRVYDLQGRRHSTLQHGLNIVKQGHKIRKFYVK